MGLQQTRDPMATVQNTQRFGQEQVLSRYMVLQQLGEVA